MIDTNFHGNDISIFISGRDALEYESGYIIAYYDLVGNELFFSIFQQHWFAGEEAADRGISVQIHFRNVRKFDSREFAQLALKMPMVFSKYLGN